VWTFTSQLTTRVSRASSYTRYRKERSPTGFLFGIYTQICRADSEVVSVARKAQSLIEKKGFEGLSDLKRKRKRRRVPKFQSSMWAKFTGHPQLGKM